MSKTAVVSNVTPSIISGKKGTIQKHGESLTPEEALTVEPTFKEFSKNACFGDEKAKGVQ